MPFEQFLLKIVAGIFIHIIEYAVILSQKPPLKKRFEKYLQFQLKINKLE
jgi:hypothetical protein